MNDTDTTMWIEEDMLEASPDADVDHKGSVRDGTPCAPAVRARVRIDRPRWQKLGPTCHPTALEQPGSRLLLIRLGFQFELLPSLRDTRDRIEYMRCQAYLWPAQHEEPCPTVLEVIPKDLYESSNSKTTLKLAPALKFSFAEASIGEASSELHMGSAEPTVVGWTGEAERAPYWDLTPGQRPLIGVRHLWMVVEVPASCSGVRIAALAEGELRTRFGPIVLGPREKVWHRRPTETILVD